MGRGDEPATQRRGRWLFEDGSLISDPSAALYLSIGRA